jgi:anti-sigma regulatory factor (Ser/Thr protein kinase)
MAGRSGSRRAKPSLVLHVPSETAFLVVVRDVTKKMAEVAGFDAATAANVALAVDEAASNVIEHAYHGTPGHSFDVRIEDRANQFCVEVVDGGDMVDPRRLPRVDLERYASERRKGGLGVHLMGKIMDSVTYQRSARKNVCCLVKRKG